uniref:ATP synthase CF1 delta subunit n=1 Tax=Hildenbrandia rivularis TaxID=135206 RepID=A0A1C9CFE2_9FLOR|nr:ATP synthase CF1 delta subunit [Hildenbrandia rivularis]AOM67106.1 ATP synthase CF1 delta subunit [Hildenbrandia rivularis]
MTSKDSVLKIAQPYAEALLELANVKCQISSITENLLSIAELLSNSKPLQLFLTNPVISKNSKKIVLRQLLEAQIDNIVMKFLYVLVDKQRIIFFDKILTSYLKLLDQLESTTLVYLTTAKPLTSAQLNAFKTKVQEMTNARTIKVKTYIDPNLIAGFTAQIGSKIIDTSLLGQLQSMASYLNTAKVLA